MNSNIPENLSRSTLSAPAVAIAGRVRAIDLLKVMALFGVVLNHFACSLDVYLGWAHPLWLLPFEEAVVLAIPGFFLASGYVLLGRRENCGYAYAVRKCGNLLKASLALVLLLTGWLYLIPEPPYFRFTGFVTDFAKSLCLQDGCLPELWFVGALIALYLLYPLLNQLYIYNVKAFGGVAVACFVIMSLAASAYLGGVSDAPFYEPSIPQPLRIWDWLGYFCLGGLLKVWPVGRYLGKIWVVLLGASGVALANHIGTINSGTDLLEFTYCTLPAVVMVAGVACVLLKTDLSGRRFGFLKSVGPLFFPSYLLCDFYLRILPDFSDKLPFMAFAALLLSVPPVLGIGTAWLIMRIPFMARLLKL